MTQDNQLSLSITLGSASFVASGPAALVMTAFDHFEGLVDTAPLEDSSGAADGTETDAAPTGPKNSAASKVPLPQFLGAIDGNDKIATAIVTWATDHEKKVKLTASQIKAYWKDTNVKVPANINRDVERAKKQGWLTRDGNEYSVTGFGRTAIGTT